MDITATRQCLNLNDLTNPDDGPHCIQLVMQTVIDALVKHWGAQSVIYRESPIVSVQDNYDKIGYPKDGASRDSRYTRYVCNSAVLRTMTSAMIPRAMQSVAAGKPDVLLACPGICYRRDCIDKIHTGEPHQLDLWRMVRGRRMTTDDLMEMISVVMHSILPGAKYRTEPKPHPYTTDGCQIDVQWEDGWLEAGECGIASQNIIAANYPDAQNVTGLAMGLGLDRLVMLVKGIHDIRLLRADDPRVKAQMQDLSPYKEVSHMPAVVRDMSLAVDSLLDDETLGDKVRGAMADSHVIESVQILSQTGYQDMHPNAIQRLGMQRGQKNVLLRVVLRALDRTLTSQECNDYRNAIYQALHEGDNMVLAENAGS